MVLVLGFCVAYNFTFIHSWYSIVTSQLAFCLKNHCQTVLIDDKQETMGDDVINVK